MDFSLVSLLKDCIKKYNLNTSELRDLAFAVCMSVKIDESNNTHIDLDKFCVSDSEMDWNDVLSVLGISPISNSDKTLPRVDKLRVISDMLSIKLRDKVEGLKLMNDSVSRAFFIFGVHMSHVDSSTEDDCINNLTLIYEAIKNSESFEEDNEVTEILDMLEEMNVTLSSKKIKIPSGYITTDYRKKYFTSCGKERFIKRNFIQEVNCILLSYLIKMDETKWISLYDIFDTIADYLNHEKIVCCVTQDIRSSLSKCHRLNNSILLVGKYSYSVYDYRFTKILLVSMYSRNLIEALNKYITK